MKEDDRRDRHLAKKGSMCGWEDEDYETANKSLFKKAGIAQINADDPQKKETSNPIPMHRRAERVPSQEREQRWTRDKFESKGPEKEAA